MQGFRDLRRETRPSLSNSPIHWASPVLLSVPFVSQSSVRSVCLLRDIPFLFLARASSTLRIKRDLNYPSQPVGYNPAGTTRGALNKTPIQSSAFIAETIDQSNSYGLDSAPMTGSSHIPFRAMTSPAATVYPQTAVCTVTTNAEYSRPIPSTQGISITLAPSSHLPTPVGQRDKFEIAKNGKSLGGAVLYLYDQSIRRSPHSYLWPVHDTHLSSLSNTPLPVKLPRVFYSGSSTASGSLNGQALRNSSSDQLQHNFEAMRMEVRRFQKRIFALRQCLAEVNKEKEAAKEQFYRVLLEQEAAREEADREMELAHHEHQARMHDFVEPKIENEEHLAYINSDLHCNKSRDYFQPIHPRPRSRPPLSPFFCYLTTLITSFLLLF